MYVIIVYDVDEKRVTKINHLLKRYAIWVQNSVFEAEISESLLRELEKRLERLLEEGDSVLIFVTKTKSLIERRKIGTEKGHIENVI